MATTAEMKWRALIAAQERSGQSVRGFAAARGFAAGTMYWWRSRLRRRGEDLVRVAVVERAMVNDEASAGFELQLGDLTLRVPTGFDEGELRRLLQALRC
jgi:hypothetical protein